MPVEPTGCHTTTGSVPTPVAPIHNSVEECETHLEGIHYLLGEIKAGLFGPLPPDEGAKPHAGNGIEVRLGQVCGSIKTIHQGLLDLRSRLLGSAKQAP